MDLYGNGKSTGPHPVQISNYQVPSIFTTYHMPILCENNIICIDFFLPVQHKCAAPSGVGGCEAVTVRKIWRFLLIVSWTNERKIDRTIQLNWEKCWHKMFIWFQTIPYSCSSSPPLGSTVMFPKLLERLLLLFLYKIYVLSFMFSDQCQLNGMEEPHRMVRVECIRMDGDIQTIVIRCRRISFTNQRLVLVSKTVAWSLAASSCPGRHKQKLRE